MLVAELDAGCGVRDKDGRSVFRRIFRPDLLFLRLVARVSTIVALVEAIYINSIYCSFSKKQCDFFQRAKILSLLASENSKLFRSIVIPKRG